ncbi:hypothetical protein [Aphanothece sacrum]|uniref:hypothetical protein n=1 Tax=Aphanothece sacrum TaxID=1122 RepID=UPI000F613D89|nr:hypothetical protein [Aphanothece sacrum]GBF86305.1 phenylalanyl-tRNA synthase subunit beta [Aphanothece sacrum FPU3]GBF87162.1 phenylalanyl-tRNA synthase subunit beta [Aphanothece sacrum FPU3]
MNYIVHLFGQDFNAKVFHKVKGTESTWNTNKEKLAGRTKLGEGAFPAADDIILIGGRARPAKVVITTGLTSKGVRKTSDRTKLPYLSYGGTSGSIPFGRLNGTDEELTAYNAIVNNFKTAGKIPAGTRVSRIKEKI